MRYERTGYTAEARYEDDPEVPALQEGYSLSFLQRTYRWILGKKIHLFLPILPGHFGRFAPQGIRNGLAAPSLTQPAIQCWTFLILNGRFALQSRYWAGIVVKGR